MAVVNKLAVLQKIQQEKNVLFGLFSNDLTKQSNVRSGSERVCRVTSTGRGSTFATVCDRG
jgi:hypothetical protein